MNLKKTENIWALGLFLGITGLLSALILAYFAGITAKPIEEAAMRSTNEALKTVLPPFVNNPSQDKVTVESADGGSVTFYGAFDDQNQLLAVAGESAVKGYAGDVQALVGINADGTIRTVLITKQSETPGLGTNICERKDVKTIFSLFDGKKTEATLPGNKILDFFSGKSAGAQSWRVAKDGGEFLYLTGATVTSRAVTRVVYNISNAYNLHRQAIAADLAKQAKENR